MLAHLEADSGSFTAVPPLRRTRKIGTYGHGIPEVGRARATDDGCRQTEFPSRKDHPDEHARRALVGVTHVQEHHTGSRPSPLG